MSAKKCQQKIYIMLFDENVFKNEGIGSSRVCVLENFAWRSASSLTALGTNGISVKV